MKVGVLATMFFGALVAYPIASFAGLAPDADGDGIPDVLDKCMLDSRNVAFSCDTDQDGYGNPCDGDFDQNFTVNAIDFTNFFVPAFKSTKDKGQGEDMDCNGTVNAIDFTSFFVPQFKGVFNGGTPKPGPSGLACAGTIPCN